MFDKNYKNAMNNISVDLNTYDKILDKIILKEELKNRKNPATPWRVAFACVACVAVVLGIVFIPRNNIKPITSNNSPQSLTVSKSYDEIYKLIKPKITYKFNMAEGEEELYTDNTVYVDGESATGGTTASAPNSINGGAKPGASNGQNTDKNSTNNDKAQDFSTTTEQVEGVSEADIVKTDGEYIYYLFENKLSIFKADGKNTSLVSSTTIDSQNSSMYGDMFLKGDRLILLQPEDKWLNNGSISVAIVIYDISDPTLPKKVATSCQEGWYNSARMVGDYIYLISNCHINVTDIDKNDPTTFVPTTKVNGVCEAVPADSIYRYTQENHTNQYTVIGAFNYKDGSLSDTASLLGGTDNIYCSQGNIILANTTYSQKNAENKDDADETIISQNVTTVSRLEIKQGNIEYKATGEVDGTLENQFFIDEHNGYFRFVTTVTQGIEKTYKFENSEKEVISYSNETFAQLTVLDSKLEKVGQIGDLAKGERVYSVRFMGDIAYFVTFRQTDPLFSADLSDPANPKILGKLKIPGFSEYMYPYGDGLLLGFGMDADEQTGRTTYLKLSMFNITDPANVIEQDKTILSKYNYSSALYNHKQMLVSPDKNLIGFAASDNYSDIKYIICQYTGNGFNVKAYLDINSSYQYAMDDIRGMFIGNEFYVVSKSALQIFDINTFLQIGLVEL